MNIEELIKLFEKYKFNIELILSSNKELAYVINTNLIRIGIFDYNYPNTGYCGKILMEHEENFDKWSKSFYKSDFPKNEEDFNVILKDLEYISKDFNIVAGNSFGRLFRSFNWEK